MLDAFGHNESVATGVVEPLHDRDDQRVAVRVLGETLDAAPMVAAPHRLARRVGQDVALQRQGFGLGGHADRAEVVEEDPLAAVLAGGGGGEAQLVVRREQVDCRSEELRPDLVHLIEDDQPERPEELLRVIPAHDRVEKADAKVLALPFALALLDETDPLAGHAQLAFNLVDPLVHQPFEVDEDQRPAAKLGGGVQGADGLARPGGGRCRQRPPAPHPVSEVGHEGCLRFGVADTGVSRVRTAGDGDRRPQRRAVVVLQPSELVEPKLTRQTQISGHRGIVEMQRHDWIVPKLLGNEGQALAHRRNVANDVVRDVEPTGEDAA